MWVLECMCCEAANEMSVSDIKFEHILQPNLQLEPDISNHTIYAYYSIFSWPICLFMCNSFNAEIVYVVVSIQNLQYWVHLKKCWESKQQQQAKRNKTSGRENVENDKKFIILCKFDLIYGIAYNLHINALDSMEWNRHPLCLSISLQYKLVYKYSI